MPTPSPRFTLAHVTHEAVDHIGGIGTVLEGLMTSPVYQQHIGRTILVGPMASHMVVDPEARLGEHGKVLYSSIDNIDRGHFSPKLKPIEWAFDVRIVYGTRQYAVPGTGRTGEAEVLLIDVFHINADRLNVFKHRLWETFSLNSGRYESSWDYEEYVRLAEPAFYALSALRDKADLPCVMFGHEYMGMPAVLQAILDGQDSFRTVFHAHECATARRLVEDHPGHDTMFYNLLDQARAKHLYVNDVFSNLDKFLRHALVSRAYVCDGVIAVGDRTRDELEFMGPHFNDQPIDLVYNGLPDINLDMKVKLRSRQMLLDYSKALLDWTPDLMMTHVTRPVISKGLWRDLKVCHELDAMLGAKKKKGVLYILTSGGGVRRAHDVVQMEENYGWPRDHREGYPDLVGPESDLWRDIRAFNANHANVQVVLVNQFGWTKARVGARLPDGMDIADLRRATDVEFGMATYEPFGISPLEPLGCGAICVISNVCGCEGFVRHATANQGTPVVISADFTKLDKPLSIDALKEMGRAERDCIEERVAKEVAAELMNRLAWTDDGREKLLAIGQKLIKKMGWDQVIESGMLPMLDRIRSTVNGKR
jgi:hypothetical protein